MKKPFVILFLSLCCLCKGMIASAQDLKSMIEQMQTLSNEKKYGEAISLARQAEVFVIRKYGESSNAHAEALLTIGSFYLDSGNTDSMQFYYKKGLQLQKIALGSTNSEYLKNMRILAGTYIDAEKYESVKPLLEEIAAADKDDVAKRIDYLEDLNNIAMVYGYLNDYKNASESWKKLLNLCESSLTKNDSTYANILVNYGSYCVNKGRYNEGEIFFTGFVNKLDIQGLEKSKVYVPTLCVLANLYIDMNKATKTAEILNHVAKLENGFQTNDYDSFIAVLDLADLFAADGNYAKAGEYYNSCIKFLSINDMKETLDYAKLLTKQGDFYRLTKKYDIAYDTLKKADDLFAKLKATHTHEYAELLFAQGNLYPVINENSLAETFVEAALVLERKLNGEENLSAIQMSNTLALLYKKRGDFNDAIIIYEGITPTIQKLYGVTSSLNQTLLNNKAVLYYDMTDYKDAEIYTLATLSLEKPLNKKDDISYPTLTCMLASIYLKEHLTGSARGALKMTLEILKKLPKNDDKELASLYNNIAGMHGELGDYQQAAEDYKEALRITAAVQGKDNDFYALLLSNAASINLVLKNFEIAQQQSLESESLALSYLTKNFVALGEDDKSDLLTVYGAYFNIVPSALYDLGANASPEFLQKACNLQLMLKAVVLTSERETLQKLRNTPNEQLKGWVNKWFIDKEALSSQVVSRRKKSSDIVDSLKREIRHEEKYINFFGSSLADPAPFDFRQITNKLPQGAAAIEFIRFNYGHPMWTDTTLYGAFVILSKDTIPHFVALCQEKEIAGLIENQNNSTTQDYITQLYGDGINPNLSKGRNGDQLYQLVWQKLETLLQGVKEIYLSPTGLLNRINFDALPADATHYLIDKYQIREFGSLRDAVDPQNFDDTKPISNVLLMGNIDYGTVKNGNSWINLPPSADSDLDEIRDLLQLKGINNRLIVGKEATEDTLKQITGHSPSILQITTHGFSYSEPDLKSKLKSLGRNQFETAENSMFRSGIILANANNVWSGGLPVEGKEDGIATAYEVANLDLTGTDLVILSTCKGALGDLKDTEGVFGLQRAFRLAGVRNMLLGLWDIPLTKTNQLIKSFYQKRLTGSSTYKSFKEAQLEIRKNNPPYFWAGLILIE